MTYYAYCGILCLMCHKATTVHSILYRMLDYVYNAVLRLLWHTVLRCSAYCTITSQPYAILCLQSYSSHCGILCLLCHNQHTMSIRGGVEDTRLEAKAKAKDSLSEDKHSRGQGQECSRPRPRTKDTKRKCSPKKKKKVFTKIFQAIYKKKKKIFKRSPLKNVFQTIFQALHKIFKFQKILLSSSRGQANFRGLEASRPRPRPRTSNCVLEDSNSDVYCAKISLQYGIIHLLCHNKPTIYHSMPTISY